MSAYNLFANYFQNPTWHTKLTDYRNRVPPDKPTNHDDRKIKRKMIYLRSVGNCWFLYPNSTLSLWGFNVAPETYFVLEGTFRLTMWFFYIISLFWAKASGLFINRWAGWLMLRTCYDYIPQRLKKPPDPGHFKLKHNLRNIQIPRMILRWIVMFNLTVAVVGHLADDQV